MFATPPSLANPRRRQAPSSSLARCPPSPHPRGRTSSKAPPPRASPPDPRHSAAFFLPPSLTRDRDQRSFSSDQEAEAVPDGDPSSESGGGSLTPKFLVWLVSSYRYDGDHVDEELARAEAAELHGAVVSKKEALHGDVVRIVSSRSKPQLRATFQRYKQDHGKAIDEEVMRSWAETMLCCWGADCGRLWRRVMLRKWLNVGAISGDSDFSADEGDEDEDEPDHQD